MDFHSHHCKEKTLMFFYSLFALPSLCHYNPWGPPAVCRCVRVNNENRLRGQNLFYLYQYSVNTVSKIIHGNVT